MWIIWKNRNEIHFNGMRKNPIIPANKVVNQWNEYRQAQEKEKKESNRQREPEELRWRPLRLGWIILNTDTAVKQDK